MRAVLRRAAQGAIAAVGAAIWIVVGFRVLGDVTAWVDRTLGLGSGTTAILLGIAAVGAFAGVFLGVPSGPDPYDERAIADRVEGRYPYGDLPPPPPPPERD